MRKPDFAERYTDKDFAEYEKRIRKVYKQAEKEIGEKLADFTEKHKARDIKMRKLVEAGKMTEADYKSWMQGQVFQGKQWRAKQQQMAETLYNANTIAQRMANGNLPKVFAMNANYMSYTAEKAAGYRIGFTMYDSATVANLIKNDPKILPFKKLNKEKDIRWNFKNIKGEVTQGIIQGESVNEIAARLQKEMPNRSYKMCRVHARTMYTSAQNAGRMESMKMHQQMGIKNKKQWMATLDERTRWMHRDLDGQIRELEEPFEIGQYSIMYPGDPFAHPSMVYNCRCSLGEVVDKYPDTYERRDNITKEVIQNMTYNEWAEMNGIANARPDGMTPVMPVTVGAVLGHAVRHLIFTPAATIAEAEEFARQFLQSKNYGTVSYRGIDLDVANKCNSVLNDVFGEYSPEYKLGKIAPMNGREKKFKAIIDSAEACYQWGGDGSLFVNPKFYKNAKTLEAHLSEIEQLMTVCLDGGQRLLDSGKYTGAKKTYIEALLNTGRQCVSQSYDFAEGTIIHEAGHMLDDKLFRKTMRDLDSPLAKMGGLSESMAKYGGGISGYATTSTSEYIAESFTAWWHGETDKLDKELIRIFEEAKKYGK